MSGTRSIFVRPTKFQTTSIVQTLALAAHFAKLAAAADAKAALEKAADRPAVRETQNEVDASAVGLTDVARVEGVEAVQSNDRRDGLRGMMFPREDSQRRLHRWSQLSMSPEAVSALLGPSYVGPSRLTHYTVPLPRLDPDVKTHAGLRDVAPYVGLDLTGVSFAGDEAGLAPHEEPSLVDVEVKIERVEKDTIGEREYVVPSPEHASNPRNVSTVADVRRALRSFDGFAGQIKLPNEAVDGREHVRLDRHRWQRRPRKNSDGARSGDESSGASRHSGLSSFSTGSNTYRSSIRDS